MSVPDTLAVLRALAGVPILIMVVSGHRDIAVAIFIVAALSDALDGWIARRYAMTTDHGVLLDPLADKALVLLTLAGLSFVGAVPLLLVAAITARELLVSGLRVLRYRAREHLVASPAAKLKTALEMCAIVLLIVAPSLVAASVGVALLGGALAISLVTLPAYFPRRGARLRPRSVTERS